MFDVFARPDLLRPDLEDIQGRLCVLRLDLTAAYDCFPREIRQVLDDLLSCLCDAEDDLDRVHGISNSHPAYPLGGPGCRSWLPAHPLRRPASLRLIGLIL